MSNYTHHTAPTQFVEANGIRFAYRRFGKKQGLPLVFNPHLLGNLDSWDPAVTDGLAREREVIVSNDRVISPTLEATMAAKMKATTNHPAVGTSIDA